LSAADIVDEIYKNKNPEDIFILSSGHAALALYAALENMKVKTQKNYF
jgi:transketolase N-terminal domain/subunit